MVDDVKEAREQLLEDLITMFHEKGFVAARVTNLKTVAVEFVAPTGRVYVFELAADYNPKYEWDIHMEMYDTWRSVDLYSQVQKVLDNIKTKGEQ